MRQSVHDIERLISRHLDGECKPGERREFNALLSRDPEARALYEEQSALDRELRQALRGVLGTSYGPRRPHARWQSLTRASVLAAAACLAICLWLTTPKNGGGSDGRQVTQARSWFVPPPTNGDQLVEQADISDRSPAAGAGSPTRWILIPGEAPGEYLVIEVKPVEPRTAYVRRDF